MINLKEWIPGTHRKVFLAGKPKSAGKTTFAMFAPGNKLILQYDLGSPTIPPGVDPSSVWFHSYTPTEETFDPEKKTWARNKSVGVQIAMDLQNIVNSFVRGTPLVIDELEIPLPDTIILDGITELSDIMVDLILAINNKDNPDQFDNKFFVWQERITKLRHLMNSVIKLPANVVLICWEDAEMRDMKATGLIKPDVGGKMDNKIAGKVDAALRCYSQNDKFFVQCRPDGIRDWIGVRGAYNLSKEVDVTIGNSNKMNPWERVFGGK